MRTLIATTLLLVGTSAFAAESLSEKASAKAHDMKRGAKKAGHRAHEAVCMESDAECLARKGKNRAVEAKDAVKDKAIETKDAVDADGKARD